MIHRSGCEDRALGRFIRGMDFSVKNADFAALCEEAGVVFIGPTPEQMRQFGLKHTAREIAEKWRAAAARDGAAGKWPRRRKRRRKRLGIR